MKRRDFLKLASLGPLGLLLLAAKPPPRKNRVTFQPSAFTPAFQ